MHFFISIFSRLAGRQARMLAAAAALGASGAAIAGAPAAAQTAPAPPSAGAPGARPHHGHLLRSLNLSADQRAQIKQIYQNARQQNANADPQTQRAAMRAAWRQVRTTVLTPDQQSRLQAAIAARRAARAARAAQPAQAPQPAPPAQG